MKYISIVALLFLIFTSCNEVNPKGEKEIRTFVKNWNDNHTQLKAPYLKDDYMSVLDYYGVERSAAEVQEDKMMLFEQFPDYTQQILGNQLTITKEGPTYLVVFDKKVSYGGEETVFASYLSVTLRNGNFKIVREGVTETSNNKDALILPKYRKIFIEETRTRQLFGDFNGDGLSDFVSVDSPVLLSQSKTQTTIDAICEGACTSLINFSAKDLNAITVENVYKSQLENLQDLNGDLADEVGFWDIKPTTKSLYVFDATTSQLLIPPVTINTTKHKNLKLIDVIKKTGVKKITVTSSQEVNGVWKLVSEVVRLE